MDKNTILNYVAKTPYNTNPNVIGNMIDALVEGEEPTGNIEITENSENIDIAQYATATVAVPGVTPTGELNITSNNTYDVTNYASAVVNVPNPSTGNLSITANGNYNVANYATASVTVNGPELAFAIGVVGAGNEFTIYGSMPPTKGGYGQVYSYQTYEIANGTVTDIPIGTVSMPGTTTNIGLACDFYLPNTKVNAAVYGSYSGETVTCAYTETGTFIHVERPLPRTYSGTRQMGLQLTEISTEE